MKEVTFTIKCEVSDLDAGQKNIDHVLKTIEGTLQMFSFQPVEDEVTINNIKYVRKEKKND